MKIDGVTIIDLKVNPDLRGEYTEMYHSNWDGVPENLVQWSFVKSKQHSIRGMRIHPIHADYTCLIQGKALYVIKDLRKDSPTFLQTEYLELNGEKLQTIVTPPGVAHGFYFREDSLFVVGITHHYDPSDELGFYFADPKADIDWPKADYLITDRDSSSPEMETLLPLMPTWTKSK
jgi:dTDP-4-dehydrorhamnose 3,5-epimerase